MNNKKLIDELKKSKASMDSLFASRLENQLHARAQEILQPQKGSSLFVNKIFMKRFSFGGIAFLILIASGINIVRPFISNYRAEQFIDNAYEVYAAEAEKSGVYYEKTLIVHSQNGKESESGILETWRDEKGNVLDIYSIAESGEVMSKDLTKVDEFGNESSYSDIKVTDEVSERAEGFKDKYICVEKFEVENSSLHSAVMEIAKSDPSMFTTYAFSEEEFVADPRDEAINALDALEDQKSPEKAKEILEQIKTSEEVVFEQNENKFIFTVDMWFDSNLIYTFNKETYKLEKTELASKEDGMVFESITYLESKFIENSEDLFDPEKNNLYILDVTVISPDKIPDENGCYYHNQKLSAEEENAVWLSLPLTALEDFESTKESVRREYEQLGSEKTELPASESTENAKPLSGFITPTEGTITANFSSGHPGIDFANRDKPEIVAAAGGTVIEVNKSGWNGGYGNTVIIDHGNAYTTLYSHLSDIYVEVGQSVAQGEEIAKMGNSGRVYGTTGIYLHFELRLNGVKINPFGY